MTMQSRTHTDRKGNDVGTTDCRETTENKSADFQRGKGMGGSGESSCLLFAFTRKKQQPPHSVMVQPAHQQDDSSSA